MGGTTLYLAYLMDILGEGMVYGVDKNPQSIDARAAQHPPVEVIEGSTTDVGIASLVADRVRSLRTMVILDSAHEHEEDLLAPERFRDRIELLFVDATKSWELADAIIQTYFPRLIAGRSLNVQQDFAYFGHVVGDQSHSDVARPRTGRSRLPRPLVRAA